MTKRYIYFTDEAQDDYDNLADELLEECKNKLIELSNNINLGQKLYNMHGRNLSDCRKIYFNNAKHRIVYRKVSQNELKITSIEKTDKKAAEIIAIGEREDQKVYDNAAKRLGRITKNK